MDRRVARGGGEAQVGRDEVERGVEEDEGAAVRGTAPP